MTSSSLLNEQQIDEYFERIELPNSHRRFDQEHVPDLKFISALHAHHVTRIPYENLSLHYAKNVNISLDVSKIHDKLVRRRRVGTAWRITYCFITSCWFSSSRSFSRAHDSTGTPIANFRGGQAGMFLRSRRLEFNLM